MTLREKKNILLVDDEKDILAILSRKLQKSGYEIVTAASGEKACDFLKRQKFHLIITDLQMGEKSGIEVLREAKNLDPELPVMILTGNGDMYSAIEAMQAGADDYLLKPCDLEQLLVRISQSFKKQDLLEELKVRNRQLLAEIAARERAEEALRDNSEKTKLFAYSVAHDLRSPAAAISGLINILHDKYGRELSPEAAELCRQTVSSAGQIVALAEMINTYIHTKEKPLAVEEIDFGKIIGLVKGEFAEQLKSRGVELLAAAPAPFLKADNLSILRVFRNFIDNALKYGGEQLSKIEIGYKENDEYHVFSVSDDGVGLNQEDCRGIFDAFKREATSEGIKGTGLGLAIVKEIAERHRGEVWVESGRERGIAFYFSFLRGLA